MPRISKRRNVSKTAAFAHLDSERHRLPAAEVDLSPEERSLLSDPNWIDEEEADAILVERAVRQEGHTGIPLREYLKRNGRRVED